VAALTGTITQLQATRLMTNDIDKVITMAVVKASTVLQDVTYKTTGTRFYRFHRAVDSLPQHKWNNYNVAHPLVRGDIETQDAEMFLLGAQIQIDDKFQRDKTIESPMALQIDMLTKALAHKYTDAFFNGWTKDEGTDNNGNPVKSFPGMKYRCDNPADFGLAPTCKLDAATVAGATVDVSLSGISASNAQKYLFTLDYALGVVGGGDTEGVVSYTPRDIWVRLPHIMRVSGAFAITKDSFGRDVPSYNGVPIRDSGVIQPTRNFTALSTRAIGHETTAGVTDNTSGTTTSQYFVKHGANNVFGIQQFGIENKDLGIDPTNGVFRNFMSQWPNGLVNRQPWDIVRLYDIVVGTTL
jgi:hypothetical protein